MNFGGQDVKEVRELKYISPSVHEVTIKSVTGEVNKNGNPLIMFTMYLKDGSADDTTDFRFYLSDKAQTVSYSKIRHIFTKCVPDSEYLGAVASDVIGLGEAYDNILRGKSLRIKFIGEKYIKKDNTEGLRSLIGYPEFAEAIEAGAEYPVVAAENSKLVFDKNDSYDLKPLPPATPDLDSGEDALPF